MLTTTRCVLQFCLSSYEIFPPACSRVYYHAYGTIRAGNTADLKSDRTFTGQKQDGTGILYYNARYYATTRAVPFTPAKPGPTPGVSLTP
jgi:guanyl-specific ribonuclease Sa